MSTKVLKKLKRQKLNTPASIAQQLRKRAWLVAAFFLLPATAATIMILLKFWVPGMAWLQ